MCWSRRVAVGGALIGGALSAAARLCVAQQAAPSGTVTLIVRVTSGRPANGMADVMVSLDGPQTAMLLTDQSGDARFPDRPLGRYVMWVWTEGRRAIKERIDLTTPGTYALPVALEGDGRVLAPVTTRALRSAVPGFDDRRLNTRGHFFDRRAIDSLKPRVTTDLLRRVPSVRLVPSGGGFIPRTRRSTGTRDCPMAIYLDGVLVDDERGAPPAPPVGAGTRSIQSAAPPSVIDAIAADLLEGMEVYVGTSEVPAQFNQAGAACGVVVLWTRARR
ncbi:MAG: hypothetical protein MUF00_16380 [Gemmatimonadaceae bacterium]|jgi:hypothetical protein|nr:hypothetical protein [Gemmatimonadaceae bacterium]